jgi:ABC-type transport system involved in cytochrome c biogenesis permease component
MRLIRLALQAILFFLLLAAVIGIGSGETGAVEKLALAAIGAVVIWLAVLVRRIGAPPAPR